MRKFFIAVLVLFLLGVGIVSATCNITQLENIYNQTNSSELRTFLEQLCSENNLLLEKLLLMENITINMNQSLSSRLDNTSLSLLRERNLTNTQINSLNTTVRDLNSSLNSTMDRYPTKEELSATITLLNISISDKIDNEKIDSTKEELIDIFDTKWNNIKKNYQSDFMTLEDYKNQTDNLKVEIYQMTQGQLSIWDRYAWYIFLSIGGILGTIIAIVRLKPQIMRKPIIKGLRPELKTVEDLTSKSDLRTRIDMMRNLKIKVVNNRILSKDQKISLLKKIDEGEIWNDSSLLSEITLIKRLSGVKNDARRRK